MVVKTKVQEKVPELKRKKSLILTYLTPSRERPDLDIQFLLENLEFGFVPKALFTPVGEVLMRSDKSKALHLIGKMQGQRSGDEDQFMQRDILLTDIIVVVNQIQKSSAMVTCKVSICEMRLLDI